MIPTEQLPAVASESIAQHSFRHTRRWVSAHMHFEGNIYDTTCDQVLRTVVAKAILELREQRPSREVFFVRYSENGPHVRLRVRANSLQEEASLRRTIALVCEQASNLISRCDWVAYIPEYARYGGQAVMGAAEVLFCASSRLTTTVLGSTSFHSRQQRLGVGIATMLALCYELLDTAPDAAQFARGFSSGTLRVSTPNPALQEAARLQFTSKGELHRERLHPTVMGVWSGLHGTAVLPAWLDRYRRALRRFRRAVETEIRLRRVTVAGHPVTDWKQYAAVVGGSMMHMTNNRIGVTQIEEAYLSHTIAHYLQESNECSRVAS